MLDILVFFFFSKNLMFFPVAHSWPVHPFDPGFQSCFSAIVIDELQAVFLLEKKVSLF